MHFTDYTFILKKNNCEHLLSAYCVPGTQCALCYQTLPTAVCKLRTIIIIRAKIYQLIHSYAYMSWVSLQPPVIQNRKLRPRE